MWYFTIVCGETFYYITKYKHVVARSLSIDHHMLGISLVALDDHMIKTKKTTLSSKEQERYDTKPGSPISRH